MSEIIIENGSVEHQWILLLSIFSNMFYFDELQIQVFIFQKTY